jgi:D-alanyl-lipoteichoic acid acyltransferase DltB (MBOAT superfamily)
MIFNSVTFLIFLTLVTIAYWALKTNLKMWMLLIASCIFYGFWRWEFLGVMFLSALTDYFTAIEIEKTPFTNKKRRKLLLTITLIINLGLLFYFKYLYFISENINLTLDFANADFRLPLYKIILPFGISFYTFETISYTVDVYRGLIKPEKKFINYALFVTFFPKLVAGPIQRASELIDQLKNKPNFSWSFIVFGFERIVLGLFLKVVLADNISPFVDEGFALPTNTLSALDVWTLAFLFGFQIYFDFSAYSHIALGSAQMLGIRIPENFNYPYVARSFKDFWKRWHISLSSWIRDYLYLPLSGIKVAKTTGEGGIGEGLEDTQKQNKTRALFLTWAIMGFWHGANWTFVVWGLMHAILIYLERILKPLRTRISFFQLPLIGWSTTILFVMISWIPFRSENLTETFVMFSKIVQPKAYFSISLNENTFIVALAITILFLLHYLIKVKLEYFWRNFPKISFALGVLKLVIVLILAFTFLRPINQFIYFQF